MNEQTVREKLDKLYALTKKVNISDNYTIMIDGMPRFFSVLINILTNTGGMYPLTHPNTPSNIESAKWWIRYYNAWYKNLNVILHTVSIYQKR